MPDQLFFDIVKMVVALAFIVGLIYGVVFVLKRLLPGANRAPGERIDMQVLSQLSMGSRQRIAVIRVQDKTLVVGVTEGSINTLAELTPQKSAAQKEADDPKIFNELLSWRKGAPVPAPGDTQRDGSGRQPGAEPKDDPLAFRPFFSEKISATATAADDSLHDGPPLFSPGERPPR